MKYGRIEGIDKPVSRLVQGTLDGLDGRSRAEHRFSRRDRALGCNSFDTAPGLWKRKGGAWRWAPGWTGAAIEAMCSF